MFNMAFHFTDLHIHDIHVHVNVYKSTAIISIHLQLTLISERFPKVFKSSKLSVLAYYNY